MAVIFPGAAQAALFFQGARCLAGLLAAVALASCAEQPSAGLPKLTIDPARINVAGLSSGAYMATQVHFAFSDRLAGAGLVAGGPYQCADGQLQVGLRDCMAAATAPDIAALAARTRDRAADGRLAPLSGLAGDRVWVLHGAADAVVSNAVAQSSAALYEKLDVGVQVHWDGERKFAHTFPTDTVGSDCLRSETPYLGACGFDAAGQLMQGLFGTPGQAVAARANG